MQNTTTGRLWPTPARMRRGLVDRQTDNSVVPMEKPAAVAIALKKPEKVETAPNLEHAARPGRRFNAR